MSKLLYRSEGVMKMAADMPTLISLHHSEVEDNRLELKPNYNMYMQLEQQGMFHGFTVRDTEQGGKLIGYATYVTTPLLHHESTKAAVADMLYILPSYRGSWVGMKLLKHAERVLTEQGVTVIIMNVKKKHDFGSMLKRLGYEQSEVQYTKHLGD